MSDIPSIGPEYQNLVELQPIVQEVRRIESFPKLSFPVGTLVIETGGRVDYVLTAGGLREERKELKEEINFEVQQKEILRKIYQNLGEDNTELKKAIENQTIKIFEVPNRDLVALSLDGVNLSAFYKKNGDYYFQMNERRKNELKYKLFLKGIEKYGLEETMNESGVYIMKKNGKELQTFSIEYYQAILEYIDFLKGFFKTTKELLEKKEQGLTIE